MFATPIERQLTMDHTTTTCGNCSSTHTGMHMLLALPGETFDHYDFLAAIKPIWKIQACIAVPFIILALPLDVLIILTIVIFRTMHTNNNVFIFGQALSDMMFTLFIPVFVVAHFNPSWYIRGSEASCFVLIAVYTSLKHSGLWMYVSVALDRFIAVHCPFWYDRNMYVKKSIKIVVVIFVFSATVGGLVIFWNNDGKHCNYYDVLPDGYKIVTFSEFNVIPVVPLVLNVLIYRTARMKRKDNIGSSSTRVVSSTRVNNGSIRARLHNHKDHLRSMHLSILLSGIFVVCWMPLNIMSAVSNMYIHDKTVSIATSVTFILYSAYPLCNAVAIVFSKQHFRPCFRLLLTTRPWRWRLLRNEFDELRRSLSLVGGALTVLDSVHSDHSCFSLHEGSSRSSRHGLHGATSRVTTENPRRVSLAVTLSRVYQENLRRASSSLSVDPTHPTVRMTSHVDGENLRDMLRRLIGGGGGGQEEEEETSENGTTIDQQPALTWTLYSPSTGSRRSLPSSETRDFNTGQGRVSGHVGFDVSTSSRFLDVHEAFSKSSKAANKD